MPLFNAIVNTTGPFLYDFDNSDVGAWGRTQAIGGSDHNDVDVDVDVSRTFYDNVIDDEPSILYLCNEHYGDKSFDVINNIPMIHSFKHIVGGTGFVDGHSWDYLRPFVRERYDQKIVNSSYSKCLIPQSLLGVENSMEVTFKFDTYEYVRQDLDYNKESQNLLTITNESFDFDEWDMYWRIPSNHFIFCLDYCVIVDDATKDKIIRFSLPYADETRPNGKYFSGLNDTEIYYYDMEFIPDSSYHMAVVFDESKRLWLYINGEVVTRICGLSWPDTDENIILTVNNNKGYNTDSSSGRTMIDAIGIYNKALDSRKIMSHSEYVKQASEKRKSDFTHFRNSRNMYASTKATAQFVPHGNFVKSMSYDDNSESWELTQDEHVKPIISLAASYDHITYLYDDGTMSGVLSDGNGQIQLSSVSDIIQHGAMEDLTVLLDNNGDITIIGTPKDTWGIKNIPSYEGVAIDIKCGLNHVVMLNNVGDVYCWGRNDNGQCDVPVNLPRIVRIEASDENTYALDCNGNIWAWGDTSYGLNDVDDIDKPIVDICADAYSVVFLTKDNELITKGDVDLVNNSTAPMDIITSIDVGKGNIVIGCKHTQYVADGFIQYTLDETKYINELIDESFAYDIRSDIAGGYIPDIYVGNGVVFARDADGMIDGFGRSDYRNGRLATVPGRIGPVNTLSSANHALVANQDGTVDGWGKNRYGSLNIPSELSDVQDVLAYVYASFAIGNDGKITSWGQYSGWYPSKIISDYRKIILDKSMESFIVLDNAGVVHEYRNDDIVSPYAGEEDVVDIMIIEETLYGKEGKIPMRSAYLLYRNGRCKLFDVSYEKYDKIQHPKTIIEKNVVALGSDTAFLDINRRGYFEYIRQETDAIKITDKTPFEYPDQLIITANSRLGFWSPDHSVSYVSGEVPPYLSDDNT